MASTSPDRMATREVWSTTTTVPCSLASVSLKISSGPERLFCAVASAPSTSACRATTSMTPLPLFPSSTILPHRLSTSRIRARATLPVQRRHSRSLLNRQPPWLSTTRRLVLPSSAWVFSTKSLRQCVAVVQYVGNLAWHQNIRRQINTYPLNTPLSIRANSGDCK